MQDIDHTPTPATACKPKGRHAKGAAIQTKLACPRNPQTASTAERNAGFRNTHMDKPWPVSCWPVLVWLGLGSCLPCAGIWPSSVQRQMGRGGGTFCSSIFQHRMESSCSIQHGRFKLEGARFTCGCLVPAPDCLQDMD